ncbi:MAG: N-acetylmuramoyl-L-alanine amidase, partial [Clostridia bacterium]|nr:N-acetylmuramoyl-L-alanine amidase [Clostridia bacterium]
PIAPGKTIKIIDSAGRPILQLEGWTSNQYKISSSGNKITLELDGPTDRNYQGSNSRLGLQNIKIYGQGQKAFVELTFVFAPIQSVSYDEAKKTARIQINAAQAKGLAGKIIVIDPGHASVQPGGWLDPGTVGKNGLKEKDVNIDLAYKVMSMLQQNGARVIMTHSGQTTLSLAGRAAIANSAGADIFVSIHVNSNPNPALSGHTTYYYAPYSNPVLYAQTLSRQKLATVVQQELVKAAGRANQGVLTANFAVLRETLVPSILVETAFMSNATEMNLLTTDAFRQKLALGIYNGIEAYFR